MKGEGGFALVSYALCGHSVTRENTAYTGFFFFTSRISARNICLTLTFRHACVALLNSVGLHPGPLVCQLACLVYLPPEMGCVSLFMTDKTDTCLSSGTQLC